jgi:hypothetical protein
MQIHGGDFAAGAHDLMMLKNGINHGRDAVQIGEGRAEHSLSRASELVFSNDDNGTWSRLD